MPLPGAISVGALLKTFAALPAGVTELACHPGLGDDVESTYRNERSEEVKVLCDPRVRAALDAEKIELCPFGGIALREAEPI